MNCRRLTAWKSTAALRVRSFRRRRCSCRSSCSSVANSRGGSERNSRSTRRTIAPWSISCGGPPSFGRIGTSSRHHRGRGDHGRRSSHPARPRPQASGPLRSAAGTGGADEVLGGRRGQADHADGDGDGHATGGLHPVRAARNHRLSTRHRGHHPKSRGATGARHCARLSPPPPAIRGSLAVGRSSSEGCEHRREGDQRDDVYGRNAEVREDDGVAQRT